MKWANLGKECYVWVSENLVARGSCIPKRIPHFKLVFLKPTNSSASGMGNAQNITQNFLQIRPNDKTYKRTLFQEYKIKKNIEILVEGEYEISNGFVGMNRNVFFKILGILEDDLKIRVMFGCCEQTYSWKNIEKYMKSFLKTFTSFGFSTFSFYTKKGKTLTGLGRLMFNTKISGSSGIWEFVVKVPCHFHGYIFIGVMHRYPPEKVGKYDAMTQSIDAYIKLQGNYCKPGTIIKLVTDMHARTLHFFVGRTLQLKSYDCLSEPLEIYFETEDKVSLEILYLRRLSASPVMAVQHVSFDSFLEHEREERGIVHLRRWEDILKECGLMGPNAYVPKK